MDDDDIRTRLSRPGRAAASVWCHAAPAQMVLAWAPPGAPVAILRLEWGPALLVERYLRHAPPQPVEIERAIDVIEDALMRVHRQLPQASVLEASGDFAAVLAQLPGRHRDDVEALFQRLVAVSLGHPGAGQGLPGDPGFFAAALLLRECMHHLGFETLA